ncbi:hypothetical protein IJ101_02260 [Candidatus Saccharibacteria bacterium]|nr:hypothetical protein [Candidatus Saccharibacteria bacterium]
MDNTNDTFNSLGLEGITLQESTTAQPTDSVASTDSPANTGSADDADNILNDLSDEETIDLFIEGIMEEKGIKAPTDEIQQDLKQGLKNQLLTQIDRSLIAELPDDKLEELNRMAVANGQIDPNLIAQMVEEANLDVTDIVGNTMVRFRELYLSQNQATEE